MKAFGEDFVQMKSSADLPYFVKDKTKRFLVLALCHRFPYKSRYVYSL